MSSPWYVRLMTLYCHMIVCLAPSWKYTCSCTYLQLFAHTIDSAGSQRHKKYSNAAKALKVCLDHLFKHLWAMMFSACFSRSLDALLWLNYLMAAMPKDLELQQLIYLLRRQVCTVLLNPVSYCHMSWKCAGFYHSHTRPWGHQVLDWKSWKSSYPCSGVCSVDHPWWM